MGTKGSSMRSLLLDILADRQTDLVLSALAGDLVAADARFNLWFSETAKGRLSEERLLTILEEYENIIGACYSAWGEVRKEPQSGLRSRLHEIIRDSAEKLRNFPDKT